MRPNHKQDLWEVSIEAWKSAAQVTAFMELEISQLRDADGSPIPESVKQFLLDVLYLRVKPRRGKFLPKALIRSMYESLLFLEQAPGADDMNLGGTPSDRVKFHLSERFNTSPSTIDQIVNPRKSRQPRKPRKS